MSARNDAEIESAHPESITLSKDDAFHLLQNARRRAVLRYIKEHPDEEQFMMRDIAEKVAAWEHNTTVEELKSQQRQRVYIALYQNHLLSLDEKDVIEYDQYRGVVRPRPAFALLEPYLEDEFWTDTDLSLSTSEPHDASDSRASLFGSLFR